MVRKVGGYCEKSHFQLRTVGTGNSNRIRIGKKSVQFHRQTSDSEASTSTQSIMEIITVHKVKTVEERRAIVALARACFSVPFWIFIPSNPDWALYARDESGTMLGGVFLDKLDKHLSLVNYIFVGTAGRGKGLGKLLLQKAMEDMKQSGCEKHIAMIRETNTASWNMFAQKGLTVLPLYRWPLEFGLNGLYHCLLMMFIFSGNYVWSYGIETSPTPSWGAFVLTLMFNSGLVLLHSYLNHDFMSDWWVSWIAAMILILSRTLASFLGTLHWNESRVYKAGQSGWPFGLSIVPVCWYPFLGQWYPTKSLWNFSDYSSHLGVSCLLGWSMVIGLAFASHFIPGSLGSFLRFHSIPLLLSEMIPYAPCEGFSGYIVYQWNKIVYIITLIISLAIWISLLIPSQW